jgi:dihydropteroate synthase
MGILNVTPDSFSDGGKYPDTSAAVAAALQMQAAGADMIDIGGESTRPYSAVVDAAEECARVLPVIERLAGQLSIPISIDTSKASVAAAAVAAGAQIINDVTGLEGDPRMADVAMGAGVGVCVMHMQGTPQTMQDSPHYGDVVATVDEYLRQRHAKCVALGIPPARICLDPGIGFGKTHQHNLELLRATRRFTEIGAPILIGHSRKGFIAKSLRNPSTDPPSAERIATGTLGVSLAVAAAGAAVLRVHDVSATVDALRLFAAAGGLSDC